MDNIERKKFWDTLCSIQDAQPEHIQKLFETIKMPQYLCRFRTLTENSLTQLQENKLYYSSADYYDDPFDTFIHVDRAKINEIYKIICNLMASGDETLVYILKTIEPVFGISSEQFLTILKENPLDLSTFPDRIKKIRTIIQKNLFSICFCGDALNETLWLKYASNYKGFALVYNFKNENTFMCGKEEGCKNCRSLIEKPSIYPVYYTEEAYNATKYALACMLFWGDRREISQRVIEVIYKEVMWEAERISLIKKKCHENDDEWRMIRPTMMPDRTCIKMKPDKVIVGLRMQEYERLLVISAAKVAGINNVEELYINDSDQLDTRRLI